MKRIIQAITAFSLLLTLPVGVRAQTMKLSDVLIVSAPELKPDADIKAFESHVVNVVAPAAKKEAPGADITLVRKDRGNHRGQYLLVCTADSGACRKSHPELAPFVATAGRDIEFRLVAPEKAGALPVVDVLGIHYIKVKPDRLEAFDRFVAEKLHPAVANLRPDLWLLYYKPVRGEEAGNYLTVFALTKASRDKYWPKGSDSDDLRAASGPSVKALTRELSTYLVEGSFATGNLAAAVFESKEWADWVLIR
jgi:hypothetical protein